MGELRKLDSVAYLRFASVYFNYSKPEDFTEALKKLGDVLEREKSYRDKYNGCYKKQFIIFTDFFFE